MPEEARARPSKSQRLGQGLQCPQISAILPLGQEHSAAFEPMDLCASVCAGVRGGSLEGAAAQDRQKATVSDVLRGT